MPDPESPRVWASLGTTINKGNFENDKIDLGITGVPFNAAASPEYLAGVLKDAQATWREIIDGIATELGRRMQEDYGR